MSTSTALPISVHVGMAGTADAVTTLQRYSLLGADVNYVHGNMLTDREFDLIAETQGTMTITPSTDMLMQFGTFPATGPAVNRGIVSGFGIDTICSAGNDLFSEMRLALAAERSGPTRRPWPAASRFRPWTCTSGTCCAQCSQGRGRTCGPARGQGRVDRGPIERA